MNELGLFFGINLGAQQPNESVQGIFFDVPIEAPYRLDQGTPRHHFACAIHKTLKQVVLGAGEQNIPASTGNFARGGIDHEIADLQLGCLWDRRPSLYGAQAGQEFLEGERLGEIIVGSGIQATHQIRHRVLRSKHKYRSGDLFLRSWCARS